MKISVKIDSLITQLNELKPKLSNNDEKNRYEFENILNKSLSANNEAGRTVNSNVLTDTTDWRDYDYKVNPNDPKKPNMRELMEVLSGRSVEDLYADPNSDWQRFAKLASDLLYGVLTVNDTRSWDDIMSSKNIVNTAREQTNKMYQPLVDIESVINSEMEIVDQYAVIKDENGNKLRSLNGNIASVEESLKNFGISAKSIPKNIENKVQIKDFNFKILDTLKNISNEDPLVTNTNFSNDLRKIAFESTTEAISRRLADEIPLEELSKL